jgi:hypothetical protein
MPIRAYHFSHDAKTVKPPSKIGCGPEGHSEVAAVPSLGKPALPLVAVETSFSIR